MRFALVNNERVEPLPKIKGTCPGCGNEVIAKCGKVNVWHWAHKNADCDPWYEPESAWHRYIKDKVPKDYQEIVLGKHRADIYNGQIVIEAQSSSISIEEIQERETFYKQYINSYPNRLVWVINGTNFEDRFFIRDKGNYYTFIWSHPRKTWAQANGMVIIHLPKKGVYFQIEKNYRDMRSGWGKILTENDIFCKLFNNCSN